MAIGFRRMQARTAEVTEDVQTGTPDPLEQRLQRRMTVSAAAICLMMAAHLADASVAPPAANVLLSLVEFSGAALALSLLLMGGPGALHALRARREEAERAHAERKQVDHLFRMTEMLQSADDYRDANAVLGAAIGALLAGFGGALYVFNNSRDRLELMESWDWPAGDPPRPALVPGQCWALKRGKPYLNVDQPGALRCEHHHAGLAVLELPMVAHGETQGMVKITTSLADAAAELERIRPLATAIVDAMSLSVSNIALRERLRTQALRDPLTGLYNRRYMEDAMSRFAALAERNGSPVSAIMIDLDHFKRLNDQFGHALGDAVLREVAATITATMRSSDIACRYGGEELLIILPDCGLSEAVAKAETLRMKIEALSGGHEAPISASFGVATMPDCARSAAELLTLADAALYHAKENGRNRVSSAPRRETGVSIAAE